ncbi:hypothetical protein J4226_02545 [Candidatus Pacearchaeota archaeon]|nr:hypothetical protein [Candidatus Pacearchaeota archaeon]
MRLKKKKVAFCFSGQARTFDLCYPYIKKNFLDPLGENKKDYDIFCCVEDEKDADKILVMQPTKILKVKSEDFNEKYKDVISLNYKKYFARGNLSNQLNQLNKIYLANNLRKQFQKENNISYNFVVRTRFDIFPISKINYSSLNKNKLYLPKSKDSTHPNYNDIIAIGGEAMLDVYSDRIKKFKETLAFFHIKKSSFKMHISLFLEKKFINFFELLIRISEKDSMKARFYKKVIIARSLLGFIRPPLKNCYTAESGLYKYLENEKIKPKIITIDFALIREKWVENGVWLDRQN